MYKALGLKVIEALAKNSLSLEFDDLHEGFVYYCPDAEQASSYLGAGLECSSVFIELVHDQQVDGLGGYYLEHRHFTLVIVLTFL
ncbi:unnamed protein product, partial [Brenthis ino]